MRLLHISDLHAGKTINRISRNEDLEYALEQVKSILKEERVDILLIGGDIFDKFPIDADSKHLIMEFLTDVATHRVHVVMIAGNHDPYDNIKSFKPLRKLANIHAYDRPEKDVEKIIFRIEDLAIACVPYIHEKVITKAEETAGRDYAHKVSNYLQAVAHAVKDARYRILLAHLMVEGASYTGTEKESSVSPFYSIRPDQIPPGFHYVALGHVHRHQQIKAAPSLTYYSGSLYQLDFSEKGNDKFANLVVLEQDGVKVDPIKLDIKRPLYEVTVPKGESPERVLEPFKDKPGLFKVILEKDSKEDFSIGVKKDLVQRILGERLVWVQIKDTSVRWEKEVPELSTDLNILSMYDQFHKRLHGKEAPISVKKTLASLLERLQHETHQA
ncbi:nuclease SbcCD, D subunit [Thermocrinis albus DSM 14484]|uniref:Nuclease SbcCD subunit D n=1 Tax=Thermocrinis albus (strain DSM 14484 / JCM 11386 / HI 11/12) TaxID=638303 RepID=D3SPU9_THEAH|nr:exonuclease subunit SbcD [Thermocrinis albus]ADC89186.1 nuclease SbcCD, D subunit [Thermocrinis albus DSM 14484]